MGSLSIHPGCQPDAGPQRLFFALWPSEKIRADLLHYRQLWRFPASARLTPPEKLHITLLFLPAVPAHLIPALQQNALSVRHAAAAPFALSHSGIWSSSGIAWAGPAQVPAWLAALQVDMAEGMAALLPARQPQKFSPHVTLARKAYGAEAPHHCIPPNWHSCCIALVHSCLKTGRYTLLQQWELPAL